MIEGPAFDVPTWTRSRIIFLAVSGALLVALLVGVRAVLLPFIMAVIIAFVLTPLVAWGETRLRLPRALSILAVYTLVIGSLYLSVAAMAPRIYAEVQKLARDLPTLLDDAHRTWAPRAADWLEQHRPPPSPEGSGAIEIIPVDPGGYRLEFGRGLEVRQESEGRWRVSSALNQEEQGPSLEDFVSDTVDALVAYARKNLGEFLRIGQAVLAGLTRGIFLTILTLMMAGFLMHTRERVLDFFRSLVPPATGPAFDRLLFRLERGLSGVVRGQLLICLVNGLLSGLGFWLLGLKYWALLAIIAGVLTIIPIFGSILSTIPAVLVALTQDFWLAVWVLGWVIGIHQLEANFLNPKILGVAARTHPVLVVFSLLVGEHFFGLSGALLAVPTLSVVQSLFNHFRFEALPEGPRDSLAAPPGGQDVKPL